MPISVTVDTGTEELTWASAHGCSTGEMVSFTASSMPSPLVAGTSYYAIVVNTTVMQVATTRDNALVPTAINLTTTGTSVVGTRDTGRVGESNLPIQNGSPFVKISNVPLAVNVLLTNIISGSRVRVSEAADPTNTLYLGEASGTTVSFTTKFAGEVTIEVRKASTAPKYKPFKTNAVIGATGLSAYISQEADPLA